MGMRWLGIGRHRTAMGILLSIAAVCASWAPVRANASEVRANSGIEALLGDWEIFDAAGKSLGQSRVIAQRPGSMLYEERSIAGAPLQQLWLYNAETRGGWSQLFVAPNGMVREFALQSASGAWPMIMGGDVRLADGATATFRLTLSIEDDGGNCRLLEMSRDGGDRWQTVFDYRYRRSTSTAP